MVNLKLQLYNQNSFLYNLKIEDEKIRLWVEKAVLVKYLVVLLRPLELMKINKVRR